jgi:deoxyribose-phosphate aldolase
MSSEPHQPTQVALARRLAGAIEHTLLRPDATARDVEQLCAQALEHQFRSVCVNGTRLTQACALLDDSGVHLVAVVAFPFGASDGDVKRFETEAAIDSGAHEIDVVINLGRLKDGQHDYVLRELRDVVTAADERPVKVILETSMLTRQENITACHLVLDSGAQFVKTSTGWGRGGATIEDVKLLRETVGPRFGIKASGGIRDASTALAMLDAGADRIGTSASVSILRSLHDPSAPVG